MVYAGSQGAGDADNEIAAFISMVPGLSTRPRTAVDRIAQQHDREAPGSLFSFSSRDYVHEEAHSAGNFVSRWMQGWFNGDAYVQPLDYLVIGGTGAALYTIDWYANRGAGWYWP